MPPQIYFVLSRRNISVFFMLVCLMLSLKTAFGIGVCSSVNLRSGTLIPVGASPRSIVAGDLNNDGAIDTVVANAGNGSSSNGSVSVLLNDSVGNLSPATNIGLNFAPQAIALNDANDDGALDIIVVGGSSFGGNSSNTIAVILGSGNGNFGFPNYLNISGNFSAVVTSDFNGDGFVDIAAANTSTNVVNVLLGNGVGSFTLAGGFSVGSFPRAMVVGDFNGDGNLDIVTANSNSNSISILFGAGNGSFNVANNITITANGSNSFSSPGAIAAGDLNNDGRSDLVVLGIASGSNSVAILLGNTAGGFNDPAFTQVTNFSNSPQALYLGRVNNDNNLDIVIALASGFSDSASRALVLYGNGAGGFDTNTAFSVPTGNLPNSIIAADLNNDGRIDLAATNLNSNNVSLIFNNGNNSFGAPSFAATGVPVGIVSGDFNGDGNQDVYLANNPLNSSTTNLTLYTGNGQGGFTNSLTTNSLSNIQQIFTADLNNDSRPDLITFENNSNFVNVFTLNANGGFGLPASGINVNSPPQTVASGDFNGDGKTDLAIGLGSSNTIALALSNNGSGTLINLSVPVGAFGLASGDFNNDGKLDLAVAGTINFSGTGGSVVLLGNGVGGFTQSGSPVAVTNPTSLATGDFNGDNKLDLAIINNTGFGSALSVTILFGTGNGGFVVSPTVYQIGQNARSITTADFNGDGKPDLVVANRDSNSVSVLLNSGSGNFTVSNYLAGISPTALAIGDFNRDGRNDVVTANNGGNNFSLLTNSCREAVSKTDYSGDGRTDYAVFRPSSNTWFVLNSLTGGFTQQQFGANNDIQTPGDFDGDGKTDLAVFRPSNGTWYILRSSTNRLRTAAWGISGDIPAVGDYDGDGRSDIAVFRPSSGIWYILRSSAPTQYLALQLGQNGDKPVQADYDGDGKTDIAVFRGGNWFILQSTINNLRIQQFGLATDKPVQGDYDGDGKVDLTVFRNGIWYILQSSNNGFRVEFFGLASDAPQPGDFDGDGKTDLAVFRNGSWYVRQSSSGAFVFVPWGTSGDIAVSAAFQIQ